MRRWLVALALIGTALLAGCGDTSVEVSREALGTVVSITAFGEDEEAIGAAIEQAYAAMGAVEAQLDVYDQASALTQFNASPYQQAALPPDALAILDEVTALNVSAEFSPTLLGVTRMYDFGGAGTVPNATDLGLALQASKQFTRTAEGAGFFTRLAEPDARLDAGGPLAPGLDVGGAAKGLALDRAREALRASGAVAGAIISSGSSTVTLGSKPDGTAWRIGVEDPRDPDRVVATFSFSGDGALSTSGDYQQYFEEDGRRYHHILHPATGRPAEGVRSLTVAASGLSGLDSDILSTALFVRGAEEAESYAIDRGLALFVVDAEGRALLVPAPADSGLDVDAKSTPRP